MPANAIPPLTPPRVIRLLVIHCLDTPNGRHIGVDDVARMHQERGHDGIQFHYLIDLAGVVQYQIPLKVPDFLAGRVSGVAGSCDVPNATHTASPGFDVRAWLDAGPQPGQVLPWHLSDEDLAARDFGRWQWSES